GAGAAELGAVVVLGVVAGGEHHTGSVEGAGGEIKEVGGGQAQVDDVDALTRRSLREGASQRGRREAAVAAEENLWGSEEPGGGRAQARRDLFIKLVGVEAA